MRSLLWILNTLCQRNSPFENYCVLSVILRNQDIFSEKPWCWNFSALGMEVLICWLVSPLLRFILRYVSNYRLGCNQILRRHSWATEDESFIFLLFFFWSSDFSSTDILSCEISKHLLNGLWDLLQNWMVLDCVSQWHLKVWGKCLDNCWMDTHEAWSRQSCSPQDKLYLIKELDAPVTATSSGQNFNLSKNFVHDKIPADSNLWCYFWLSVCKCKHANMLN